MDERGLGKRLQEARKKVGLTQQELCERANLSFSTLTKIERGAIKAPSIFTVQAIAATLGISLDELVGAPRSFSRKLGKTKSGASFIYFDMNGCLVRFYQPAFAQIALETGVPMDAVETAFWHYNDDANRGDITLEEFNRLFAQRIGVEQLDWGKVYLETIKPIKEMQDTLIWASENYRVGLLTNSMPTFVEAMIKNGTLPNINYDAIIDSSLIGTIKPEPSIYKIAAEKANVSPDEIMFIDDSRMNLTAAEKQGWHVFWFDDSQIEESVARVRDALDPA